jgi:hypothetical protein
VVLAAMEALQVSGCFGGREGGGRRWLHINCLDEALAGVASTC